MSKNNFIEDQKKKKKPAKNQPRFKKMIYVCII